MEEAMPVRERMPEIIPVSDEINEELLKDYDGEKTGWLQVGPQKYLLPSGFGKYAEQFLTLKTRPDDIWICTFPRTGTTLTQELVWMIVNGCQFEAGKKSNLWTRSPFLEIGTFFHDEVKKMFLDENQDKPYTISQIESMSRPGHEVIDEMPSPRIIKTHLPPSLLPFDIEETKAKIIYVARNPKDISISFYHLMRLWRTSGYNNNFQTFAKQFVDGIVPWGPYWPHTLEGWENRNKENYFFMFYEELVKDMPGHIKKISDFLGYPITDEMTEALNDHLDIKNFKNNPSVNFEDLKDVLLVSDEQSFIRQGKDRGTVGEFTDEIKDLFDEWILENYENTDLRFPSKM